MFVCSFLVSIANFSEFQFVICTYKIVSPKIQVSSLDTDTCFAPCTQFHCIMATPSSDGEVTVALTMCLESSGASSSNILTEASPPSAERRKLWSSESNQSCPHLEGMQHPEQPWDPYPSSSGTMLFIPVHCTCAKHITTICIFRAFVKKCKTCKCRFVAGIRLIIQECLLICWCQKYEK